MKKYSLVFVSHQNTELAQKLARLILKQKLAACIHILPQGTSIYAWKGKFEESPEVLMMIKTTQKCTNDEIPEIIAIPIDSGLPAYLRWIGSTVKRTKDD